MNTDNWYNRLANLIIGLSLLIISFGWWPAFRAFRAGGLNKFGFGEAGYLHTESWTSPDNGWCAIPRPSGTLHAMGNSLKALPACVREDSINWDSLLPDVLLSMVMSIIVFAILWYIFIGPSSIEYSECEDDNCPCVDHGPQPQASETESPLRQAQIPSHSGG